MAQSRWSGTARSAGGSLGAEGEGLEVVERVLGRDTQGGRMAGVASRGAVSVDNDAAGFFSAQPRTSELYSLATIRFGRRVPEWVGSVNGER